MVVNNVSQLPVIAGKRVRGMEVRIDVLSRRTIPLRRELSVRKVARELGISEARLKDVIVRGQKALRLIPLEELAQFRMRENESTDANAVARALVGRFGDEKSVLEFNLIKALKSCQNIDQQIACLSDLFANGHISLTPQELYRDVAATLYPNDYAAQGRLLGGYSAQCLKDGPIIRWLKTLANKLLGHPLHALYAIGDCGWADEQFIFDIASTITDEAKKIQFCIGAAETLYPAFPEKQGDFIFRSLFKDRVFTNRQNIYLNAAVEAKTETLLPEIASTIQFVAIQLYPYNTAHQAKVIIGAAKIVARTYDRAIRYAHDSITRESAFEKEGRQKINATNSARARENVRAFARLINVNEISFLELAFS